MEIWDAEDPSNPFLYSALITFLSYVWTQDSDCVHTENRLWRHKHSSPTLVFLLLENTMTGKRKEEN